VILVAYRKAEKEKLVKLIWEKYGISTEGEGLLAEVSNIIFGSFIGGLAEFAKINVSLTPPKRLEDPSEISHFDDPFVILGEVVLIPEINGKITAKIIAIPTRDSIFLLLDKLGRLLE
jgi:CheC-like family.